MIEIKKLKSLVGLMVENDLTEMDLEGENEKVKLRRGPGEQVQYVQPGQPPVQMPTAPSGAASQASARDQSAGQDSDESSGEPSGNTIDSPMVGTFYLSPSPDAETFVNVGDKVESDTVVCIVEAMKVFNEIKAETSGTVAQILVENGQPVEYGQALFRLN